MRPRGPLVIVEIHLDKIFADSAKGAMGPADSYERVCGTIPKEIGAGGNMGLDADEDYVYFSYSGGPASDGVDVNNPVYSQYIEPGTNPPSLTAPGAWAPARSGLASMNLKTGEVKLVIAVPFQIGHVQTNPWVHGEIVFCWETGGKAPQRTWTSIPTARPSPALPRGAIRLGHPRSRHHQGRSRDRDEAGRRAAIRNAGGHPLGQCSATGEHPSGVGVVNLRTHEIRIVGQVPIGDPGLTIWHVNGSADGRWAAADDFQYRLWVNDRHNGEMLLLASMKQKTDGNARGPHSSDLQRGRDQDRDPIGDDFAQRPFAEHCRRALAEKLARAQLRRARAGVTRRVWRSDFCRSQVICSVSAAARPAAQMRR